MVAIGKVKHPKPSVDFLSDRITTRGAIKISAPQLRLAERIQVTIRTIGFQNIDDRGTHAERGSQFLWPNEIKIVSGRVVFGKCAPHASHQAAEGKIETGRAVLPLVVAIRREFQEFKRLGLVLQDMRSCAIDFGVSSTAFLVMKTAQISDTSQHQTVPNAPGGLPVSRKPGDRSDRAGNEQKSIGVTAIGLREQPGQKCRD